MEQFDSNKDRKKAVVEAVSDLVKEYRHGKHQCFISKCTICKLTSEWCGDCIMIPFRKPGFSYHCIARYCAASSSIHPEKAFLAMKFWEKVLRKIKRAPEKMFTEDFQHSKEWATSMRRFDNLTFEEFSNDEH